MTLVLVALAALAGFQPGFSEDQDIEQLRQAAERGEPEAQNALGRAYDEGQGVAEDDREAVKWYRMAAEQGSSLGQYFVGKAYANGGVGVEKDFVKAYTWFTFAVAGAYREERATRKAEMDQLRSEMTSEQIAEAQKLAAEISKRIESSKPQ